MPPIVALIAIALAAGAAVTTVVRAATRSPLYYSRYRIPWRTDSARAKIAWLSRRTWSRRRAEKRENGRE
jgi:CMP-2-keto-3-deoxyoctulosonic acid synthetase